MSLNRNVSDRVADSGAVVGINDDFVNNLVGKLQTDIVSFISKFDMRHKADDHKGDNGLHNGGKTVSPGSEDIRHLLLVRSSARTCGVVADPGSAVENVVGQVEDQSEQVEVAKLLDIKRVDVAFSRYSIHHNRSNILTPVEVQEHISHQNYEHRVVQKTLEAVGDQKRYTSARPDDHGGDDEQYCGKQYEGRQIYSADVEAVRQTEEEDEEVGCHGRSDGVGDHFGNRSDRRRDYTETAAVTHFKELTDRQSSCGAVAVDAVSAQAQNRTDGQRNCLPERHGPHGSK